MDSIELKHLITSVDDYLRDFAIKFDRNVKPIEGVFRFSTHNTNEFTNVYVAKKTIEEYLTINQGCKIAVRELPISYSYNSVVINTAKDDTADIKKHSKNFKNKSTFSIDSYFDVDIDVISTNPVINQTHIKYLFIEYKSSKLFEYLLLADDFIKYKIYTNNHEDDTCFAFINFSKKEMYPTILKKGKPEYVLLPRKINKSLFSSDDHVFLYIPQKLNASINIGDDFPVNNFKKSYRLIEEIEKTITEIDENDIEKRKHICLNNDFYVNNIGAFKNGVSTAEILLNCYSFFINPIYEKLREKTLNIDFDKELLSSVKNDFFRYEKDVYGAKRNRSLKDGLNTGYKSSLNVLVLFNYLNLKYQLGFKTNLKSFLSEEADGQASIDYNDILNDNSSQLLEYALNNNYIDELALNVLVFIHNLYERILDFDSYGSYSFKKEYLLIKKTNKLQKLIDELSHLLGFKKTINIFGEHIEEDGVNFFVQAFNLLNDDNKNIE